MSLRVCLYLDPLFRNILTSKGQSKSMKLPFLQLFTAFGLLALVGCNTSPKSGHPPARGAEPSVSPPAGSSAEPVTSTPTLKPKSTLPAGEYAILVESVPDGATVVVNGIPVGKAPQRILLPGTQRGFFRDQVSLKVRFIGSDADHPSQTVEELLTPLDRIPAGVRFTPSGATRLPRA